MGVERKNYMNKKKNKRILFYDAKSYTIDSFNELDHKGIEFTYIETKLNEDTVKFAKGYDAICVFVNDTVNNKVINKLSSYGIKLILLRCAGYNNVDLVSANKNGIAVFRVPAYSPYAVAEHAFALLNTINRRTHKAYIRTREYNFSLENLTGMDLHDKTIGIVGTGKIGKVMINIAKGYGMKILAYDPYPDKNLDVNYVNLETLFKSSDIISLHCPLLKENKHMINADSIKKMKKGVIIINTSRGALINAKDLYEGLFSRHIGAACLDVYEEEADVFYENRSNHILDDVTLSMLISLPNVIVTSHQAFLTKEALSAIATTTLDNAISFFKGKENETNRL